MTSADLVGLALLLALVLALGLYAARKLRNL